MNSVRKFRPLPVLVLLLASGAWLGAGVPAAGAADKVEIKKCKDDQGQWHYGDNAAEECARSKITVIDDRGVKRDEVKAPPTPEELARQASEEAAAKEAAEREAEEKRARELISAKYDSEEAIIRARDERIAHVDRQEASYKDMLGRLQKRLETATAQGVKPEALKQVEDDIAAFERAITAENQKREEIMQHYAKDLADYRAVKNPEK